MPTARNILEAIGSTPLVELRRVVPSGHARIVVKMEGTNPTGNMKDRMARAAIEAAEADGRLQRRGPLRHSAPRSSRSRARGRESRTR